MVIITNILRYAEWFLLWSKLEHNSDGGYDTDGIDNQPIN
jgi:hypothetical protein